MFRRSRQNSKHPGQQHHKSMRAMALFVRTEREKFSWCFPCTPWRKRNQVDIPPLLERPGPTLALQRLLRQSSLTIPRVASSKLVISAQVVLTRTRLFRLEQGGAPVRRNTYVLYLQDHTAPPLPYGSGSECLDSRMAAELTRQQRNLNQVVTTLTHIGRSSNGGTSTNGRPSHFSCPFLVWLSKV